MKAAPENVHLHEWVTDLHWIEQAKVLAALREPDSLCKPSITMLVFWLRRVTCRLRADRPYFYFDGKPELTHVPTPDDLMHAMSELYGANRYGPMLRDALRVISMRAEAPTDRATALRFLSPLIEWMDDARIVDDTLAD